MVVDFSLSGIYIYHTDSNLVPEPVQDMFDRVRNSADFMPLWQMEVKCMHDEY